MYLLCIFITDGFKDDRFGIIYDGEYSIDVHTGTNAIGLPVQMLINPLSGLIFHQFFPDSGFANFSYVSTHWRSNFTTINGNKT